MGELEKLKTPRRSSLTLPFWVPGVMVERRRRMNPRPRKRLIWKIVLSTQILFLNLMEMLKQSGMTTHQDLESSLGFTSIKWESLLEVSLMSISWRSLDELSFLIVFAFP